MAKQVVESCRQLAIADIAGDLPDRGSYVLLTFDGKEQHIEVAYSDRARGGRRSWWLCPDCARRCEKLYCPPGAARFACRLCYGLAYQSQQEDGRRRRWRHASQLAEMEAHYQASRLVCEPPGEPPLPGSSTPARPRGRPRTKRHYTHRALLPVSPYGDQGGASAPAGTNISREILAHRQTDESDGMPAPVE